jgi:circadian clock protein KaiB
MEEKSDPSIPMTDAAELGSSKFGQAMAQIDRALFRLYVAGSRPGSLRAITSFKALCERYLPEHYDLEIIDIYQQPELAAEAGIVAAPTLVKNLPLPSQRLVGDLSDIKRVLTDLAISEYQSSVTP